MAVTKLRADAPPFLSRCHIQSPLLPPLHHQMAVCAYHPAAACSPAFTVIPSYPAAPFLVPAAAPGPIYGFHPPPPPHPHPAAVPVRPFLPARPRPPQRKAKAGVFRRKVFASLSPQKPAGTGAFLCKSDTSPPPATPPAPLSSKDDPSPPPSPTKPAPLSREALPHGVPPHKLMLAYGGRVVSQKRQARAAEPVKTGQEPAPPAGPRHGKRMSPPRLLRGQQQQAAGRGRSGKDLGCRQAKAPVERARKPAARSPSPVFTTRPPSTVPAPEWRKQRVTTVMIRNIPNKLKPCEMMQLLDEHCARANSKKKKKKPVLAAYDFLYLPMDFSKRSSNMGYAFVNLTTAEAARGLHYALHGARWKVHGTKKVIDICAARIQGKEALVSHFSGSTFPCHTDEYLPAAFSPPRDGAAGPSAVVKHVGNRVHTQPPPPQPAPLPLPVAPAPVQQEWRLKQSPSS